MHIAAGVLAVLLGLAHVAQSLAWISRGERERAATLKPGPQKIPLPARGLFGFGGILILTAGILSVSHTAQAWIPFLAGWILIQTLAIYNGLKTYGRLSWSHHLIRLAIFGGIFILFWLSR